MPRRQRPERCGHARLTAQAMYAGDFHLVEEADYSTRSARQSGKNYVGTTISISVRDVQAGVMDPRRSAVVGNDEDNGDGTFTYDYEVFNLTDVFEPAFAEVASFEEEVLFIIRDWELPFFPDAGIDTTQIVSPDGWSSAIETIGVANPDTGWGGVAQWQVPGDPFYAGPTSPFSTHTQVVHWYVTEQTPEKIAEFGIFPQESLDGFGFVASFGPTDAPYQASWFELPVQTGDPEFPLGSLGAFPASPQATSVVPEPATLAIFSLSAIGMVGMGIRRRKQKRA